MLPAGTGAIEGVLEHQPPGGVVERLGLRRIFVRLALADALVATVATTVAVDGDDRERGIDAGLIVGHGFLRVWPVFATPSRFLSDKKTVLLLGRLVYNQKKS